MMVIDPMDAIVSQNENTNDLLTRILTELKNWNKDGPTESVDSDKSLFTIYKKGSDRRKQHFKSKARPGSFFTGSKSLRS